MWIDIHLATVAFLAIAAGTPAYGEGTNGKNGYSNKKYGYSDKKNGYSGEKNGYAYGKNGYKDKHNNDHSSSDGNFDHFSTHYPHHQPPLEEMGVIWVTPPTAKPTPIPTPYFDYSYVPTAEENSSVPIPTYHPSPLSSAEATQEEIDSLPVTPTYAPTNVDSEFPSSSPSYKSETPSIAPSAFPSIKSSNEPSDASTLPPSKSPTDQPTSSPTRFPTEGPTNGPTNHPTDAPTDKPTLEPTIKDTSKPSASPSISSSSAPSSQPSTEPTDLASMPPSELLTNEPTSNPTRAPTDEPTFAPSNDITVHPSAAQSNAPSFSPSTADSVEPSLSPTNEPTRSPTLKPTSEPTSSPIEPSSSPTEIPSLSPTPKPTNVPTSSPIEPSSGPTDYPSMSPMSAPTNEPTSSPIEPSSGPTETPSLSPTSKPTNVPTSSPIEPSSGPTETPSLSPMSEPTNGPTSSPIEPSSGPTDSPSLSPTPKPTNEPTSSPFEPSSGPTYTPSMSPMSAPTNEPTSSPIEPSSGPTETPSLSPTPKPTNEPSLTPIEPSANPTKEPSLSPTPQPTIAPTTAPLEPSANPTNKPSLEPTDEPTDGPTTAEPSVSPTKRPSKSPATEPTTDDPTLSPTRNPSITPSVEPTSIPTMSPNNPTAAPTKSPSSPPTSVPTTNPTSSPLEPTLSPTHGPSFAPTSTPSKGPSSSPIEPTSSPTYGPSNLPSREPTNTPTEAPLHPSSNPTVGPSEAKTTQPTSALTSVLPMTPTNKPSRKPSSKPTSNPSSQPSVDPTGSPSHVPSSEPTVEPSPTPSVEPSRMPTAEPTNTPTTAPLEPTDEPTDVPTQTPTYTPTSMPTYVPSSSPNSSPSSTPSETPSRSMNPTDEPTQSPTQIEGKIEFQYLSAANIVKNYLRDPSGLVKFRNITSSQHPCFALFENGHSAGKNKANGKYLLPDSGLMLSTGNPDNFNDNNSDKTSRNFGIADKNTDLLSLVPQGKVLDSCFIQFEFACPPETDIFTPVVNFDYIFSSEEYNEYVGSKYNDAFGFFLNGNNIALLPDGITPVAINNVNGEVNSQYFIGNELGNGDTRTSPYPAIEADGFTKELTALAQPKPGWNTIKLEIGDVSDHIYDSWILLEAGTFTCAKRPTLSPTEQPTDEPTRSPSSTPSVEPSDMPSTVPTIFPSESPSSVPSVSPTRVPSRIPSIEPSEVPSSTPSVEPSSMPTSSPSAKPTRKPTKEPTRKPTNGPTTSPTTVPSFAPSVSMVPTFSPTQPLEIKYLPANELVKNVLQDPNGLVKFRNITSSNHACFAFFENGHSAGRNKNTGKHLLPDSGIMLSSGNPDDFIDNDGHGTSTNFGINDPNTDLRSQVPQGKVLDSCFIQFEFSCPPETDMFTPVVNFDYIFSSEEYNEYVGSQYNDAFGFFLNGENIALLPDGTTPVTINNVNEGLNSEYFIENELQGEGSSRTSPYPSIEPDGLTKELTAYAKPKPGWNTIKLEVGDVSDPIYDSWTLLEAGTFACAKRPTMSPTESPTDEPTAAPTAIPSSDPSGAPSSQPSAKPSISITPSKLPSLSPSITVIPTASSSPSSNPSAVPSISTKPSENPTAQPTKNPTRKPTSKPSNKPTKNPTSSPTNSPSLSAIPTVSPTTPPSPQSNAITPVMEGNVTFTYLSAVSLVRNYLQDPNGLVKFRNITSSQHACFALFENGHSSGRNKDTGKYLLPDSGIILSTGNPDDFNDNDSDGTSTEFGIKTGNSDLLSQVPQAKVFDSCFIQFEFSCPPETDVFTPVVNFDYIFSSEEYNEYVGSEYNDAFGFFLNGNNIALLPDGVTPVAINNVNDGVNSEYFISNELKGRGIDRTSPYPAIEADGFTKELTALAEPEPGWNTIKLEIGDISDELFDSWVLLEAGTFACQKRPTLSPTYNPTDEPTIAPTTEATDAPSFSNAPTYPYPCRRSKALRELYSTISDPTLFDIPGTPQHLALDWITYHDELNITLDELDTCHAIQRYVLAVFYFSTNGYAWESCSAPKGYDCKENIVEANDNCNATVTRHDALESGRIGANETYAWLTPVHECQWGGVACYNDEYEELAQCLEQIDFKGNNIGGNIPEELDVLKELRYFDLDDLEENSA